MGNDKGFSLLELIVTVAIMGILVVGAVGLTGAQGGWKVNKAAELIDSALNRTMTQAMSKGGNPGLLIYQLDGAYYAVIVTDSCRSGVNTWSVSEDKVLRRYELGRDPMEISVSYVGTMGETVPDGILTDQTDESNLTSVAEFTFQRSTGAIGKVTVGGVECYYTGIGIVYGSRSKEIEVHAATGAHKIL